MSSAQARPLLVSADDYSSAVSIIAWVFLVTTFFGVAARLSTRYAISRKLKIDDLLIIFALVLSIGFASSLSIEAINGLGRHVSSLNEGQLQKVQQLNYASSFLYAGSLCLTKLSVVALLRSLSPNALHQRSSYAIGILVTAWTLTSVLVIAFQCQLPKTWDLNGNKCINEVAFWTYFETVNILTDSMLVLLPLGIIWNLQARKARKAIIFGCFAVRILAMITAVIRIVYLRKFSYRRDFTFKAWPAALCALIEESISIIAACIPYLKPFLESLESGMMNKDKFRREGLTELYTHADSKATIPREAKEVSQRNTRARLEEYVELESVNNENDRDDGVYSGHSGHGVPSRSIVAGPGSHDLVIGPTCGWESESQTSETKTMGYLTTLRLTSAPRVLDGTPF